MMSDAKQYFRGGYTCVCLVTIIPLIEKEMISKGIIKHNIDVYQWGYRNDVSASAGTHAEAGVLDVGQFSDSALKVWREWGVEMQRRTRAQGFDIEHGHGVVKGCIHRSNAAYLQHLDWEKGKNGLRSHGPITGPEPKGKNTPTWQVAMKTHSATKPPPPVTVKPGWSKNPIVKLSMAKVPGEVSYLQGVVRVAGVTTSAGRKVAPIYVLAQDPGAKGDTRFMAFSDGGAYLNSMVVKNGGHGQTFHAYRSAAGNLYIWTLIGETAYRIAWQPGKTITGGSPGVQRMSYGTARPVGTHEHYVGFRAASSTHESFSIHDRFGFTDPKNNSSAPLKKVTLKKDMTPTQQSWAVSFSRIYRFNGKTNTDAGDGSKLHVLDVFDWSGKALLMDFDVTAMSLPGATSDEPEGLTFTGTPGSVLAGKRSGPNNHGRTYPIWQMVGLP
jgi:hypothetical protein